MFRLSGLIPLVARGYQQCADIQQGVHHYLSSIGYAGCIFHVEEVFSPILIANCCCVYSGGYRLTGIASSVLRMQLSRVPSGISFFA